MTLHSILVALVFVALVCAIASLRWPFNMQLAVVLLAVAMLLQLLAGGAVR